MDRRWYLVLLVLVAIPWLRISYILWECACNELRLTNSTKGTFKNKNDLIISHRASELQTQGLDSTPKRICYYAIPRPNNTVANLSPADLQPDLCTHIIISGAKIMNNTIVPIDKRDEKVYAEINLLKRENPNLQVMLCLGGEYSELVRDPKSVAIFAYNAQQYLLKHKLDGVDLDWEFPAWPAWRKSVLERKWFTYLVLQLNNALKLAMETPLLLSLAVGAAKPIVDRSYEVDQLAKYVDFVSIMGYDYHSYQPYFPFTGHNAPLRRRHIEIGYFSTLNIEWSTQYWIQKGMPKDKLVVGIPTYGRTWSLLNNLWHNVGAPALGSGMLGGYATYTEACVFVKEGATAYFDDESEVPYAVRGTDWISYDNPKSIKAKAEWIKSAGVAGIMMFDLNSDDWTGMCSEKKFELHSIVKDIFS